MCYNLDGNRMYMKEKLVAQPCLTLCNIMDCSPPGSSVHGILQARILERVATSYSRRPSRPRDRTQVSCIWAPLVAQTVKNPPANSGDSRDWGLIPESGRSPGVGNGNPLQYSCPEYLIDRGGLRATVHEVAKEVDMTETTR